LKLKDVGMNTDEGEFASIQSITRGRGKMTQLYFEGDGMKEPYILGERLID